MTAVVSVLTGCGLVFDRDPPDAVASAVEHALDQLQGVEGVVAVTSTHSADIKDGGPLSKPAAWTVRISVSVAPNMPELGAVAVQAEHAFASVRRIVKTVGELRIPADAQGAAAVLEFAGSRSDSGSGADSDSASGTAADSAESPVEAAAALTALRSLTAATSVFVAQGRSLSIVSVESPAQWSGVASALRELPHFGSGALSSVTVDAPDAPGRAAGSITVETAVPTPGLIAILSDLALQHDVQRVTYTGMEPGAGGRAVYARPSLRIEVSSRATLNRTTSTLTGLDEAYATAAGLPRAAFTVGSTASEPMPVRTGYLGRALGAAEPDDLIRPVDESAAFDPALAVVLEPTAAAVRLEADGLAVLRTLTDAGDSAGIRGAATVSDANCGTGAARQVQGSVVIPLFQVADDAQDAVDAITAAWIAGGFTRSDRAMGTDIYSAEHADAAGAQRLTIRGTADGISIHALAACVIAR